MNERRESDERLALLEQRLDQHMAQMDGKVDALTDSVRDLVDAWRAAGLFIAMLKTAAAVVLAVGVIFGAIRYGINPEVPK